jgi:hypothetical protein
LWSSGEKKNAALPTTPLFPPQLDLPGSGRQLPLGEGLVGLVNANARLLALGTTRRLLLRGPRLTIGGGMLFEQETSQFLAQQTGHVLPFREGHQLILVALAKHALEGLACSLQPTLAQSFPILAAQK